MLRLRYCVIFIHCQGVDHVQVAIDPLRMQGRSSFDLCIVITLRRVSWQVVDVLSVWARSLEILMLSECASLHPLLGELLT